jgi:hypothetical protein
MTRIFSVFFILFCLSSVCCCADDLIKDYKEHLNLNKIENLKENLPKDTISILDKINFDLKNPLSLLITPNKIFEIIIEILKQKISRPFAAAMSCLGISVLCSVFSEMGELKKMKLGIILKSASACAAASFIAVPVLNIVSGAILTTKCVSNFVLCLAPVMAGSAVLAGKPIFAAVSGSAAAFACQSMFSWVQNFIEPVIKVLLGLSVSMSVSSEISFSKLFDIFYKIIKWMLTITGIIFAFSVSLQKKIAAPLDFAACKGFKFTAGLVPIIGSYIGDASESIRACYEIIKTSIGAFGVLAFFFTFLPCILECGIWIFSLFICEFFCEIFAVGNLSNSVRACRKIITVVFSVIIFCFVTFIIASGILTS